MYLKKDQISILIVNIVLLFFFIILFFLRKNYEFILYIGVIIFFAIIIIATNKKVKYPNYILWGLTLWALLHMAGGGIYIQEKKLYELILLPLSTTYSIFKYDQFVHIIGFGVSTLLMHHLLKPSLKTTQRWISLSIVIVMAGLGV